MKKVFFAGEGPNEIGRFSHHPSYRTATDVGVLEAVALQAVPNGWHAADGMRWKDIRKVKVGAHASAEERNVKGVALRAKEAQCDVLVFSRDRDGDERRQREVQKATSELSFPTAGAVAVESLESWLLAIGGELHTEDKKARETALVAKGIQPKDAPSMVSFVQLCGLSKIPPDATSLNHWIKELQKIL